MADQSAISVGVANLTLKQWNDRQVPFTIQKENPNTELLEPWDLTTLHDIRLQVRYYDTANSPLYATLTLDDQLSIIGADSNVLNANFNVAFFNDNTPEALYYDILFKINESDEYRTYVQGTITTDLSVTKPS